MGKKILSRVVIFLLLFTVITVTAFAAEKPMPRAKFNPLVNLAKRWSFAGTEQPVPGAAAGVPLGQAVERAPMNGPGYKVGDTWYEYQRNGSMGRMITHYTFMIDGVLYMFVIGSYMYLPDSAVFHNRKVVFWTWDAYNGTSPCPAGVGLQTDDEYAGYTTTQVTSDARAIVTCHNRIDPNPLYQTQAYFQEGAGICAFYKDCRVPDGLANACEYTPTSGDGESVWPAAAWQEGPGFNVLHVLAQEAEPSASDPQALMYWRLVGHPENPDSGCVWEGPMCIDYVYTLAQDVDATDDGRVILAWTANLPCDGPNPCPGDPYPASGCECRQHVQLDNDLYYMISEDYGDTWQPRVNVTQHTDSCETDTAELRPYRAYVDVSVLFDSRDKWHIVWNERSWPGDANCGGDAGLYRNRIFHWSEDLENAPGSDITYIRTVHNAEWDQQQCNGGAWMLNACKQTISECNGKMYVLFTQFNDGPAGIFDDCAASTSPGYPTGAANGDLYVCVSNDWGISWDKARDITNTRQRWNPGPPCDHAGGAGGPCPSEHWSVTERRGTDYVGSWPDPDNLIDINGLGPTGWYINTQYIDDPSPGAVVQNEGWWQLADVKWFRLDCDTPITCPAISLSPPEIGYPCWTKHGVQKDVDVDVENTGNATLDYTLTLQEDAPNPCPGWLTVSNFDGSVPAGLGNVETGTVHINTGGVCNTPGTIRFLKGRLNFNVTDPCANDATLEIKCWVTDTLIPPVWDTIFTVCDGDTVLGLTVANTGNFGNKGRDSVTMDYTKWSGDTCHDASVYLYDGSPVVGYVKGNDTLCNFSIYNTTYVKKDGFVPIGDYTPTTDMGEYEVFESGPFVTHDSQVVVEKTWYAPKSAGDSCSFIIERITVYGRTGTVSGVRVGEAVDFDIPSDSGADNSSGFDAPTRWLIYQQGAEYDAVNDYECENNKRFGGISFLEGYRNDTLYKTGPFGAYTASNGLYVHPTSGFVPEELYANMAQSGYMIYSNVDSPYVDLHTVMTFDTGLTVSPTTVYKYYVGIITHWNGDLNSFKAEVDASRQWYENHGKVGACCDTTTFDCRVTTDSLCNGTNEEYQGDWTDCDPNPCHATCCNTDGIRGDVNMSGSINVADITYLTAYLKQKPPGSPAPPCFEEGDVNGNGSINVGDVTYLTAYLKQKPPGSPAPPACP
jgi:hypothetical protein